MVWGDRSRSGGDNPYQQFNYGLIENGIEVRYGTQPADYLGMS